MFFITNITKPPREITIGDLNLSLGPNKSMDLEKVRKRSEIDESQDLKRAIKSRYVEVRHNSRAGVEPVKTVVVERTAVATEAEIERIRSAVREEVKQELASQLADLSPNNALLVELLEQMKELKEIQSRQPGPGLSDTPAPVEKTDDGDSISEEKLAQIHALAVKRTAQPMEGNMGIEQKSVQMSVADRVKLLNKLAADKENPS